MVTESGALYLIYHNILNKRKQKTNKICSLGKYIRTNSNKYNSVPILFRLLWKLIKVGNTASVLDQNVFCDTSFFQTRARTLRKYQIYEKKVKKNCTKRKSLLAIIGLELQDY